jgi:tRNA(Met) cytidine acetyltransferase
LLCWYKKHKFQKYFYKLIISSTIHGYEGSGRVLLKYINEYFKRSMIIRLKTPIRYYPNDPLEKTMYRIFHLDAEPEDIDSSQVYGTEFKEYGIEDLSENYELLRKIYGLLVLTHYRNEPDDLVLLLDTNYFKVFGLEDENGRVIGVAQIRSEEYSGLNSLGKSTLLLNILYRYGLLRNTSNLRIARIVRIAVTPSLQRRGYGSRLLRFLENKYSTEKYDLIGAICYFHL